MWHFLRHFYQTWVQRPPSVLQNCGRFWQGVVVQRFDLSLLWKTGRQNSGRCRQVVVSSGLNVYQWRQIWNNLYFSLLVFNLFTYCHFLFSNLNVKFFIFYCIVFLPKEGVVLCVKVGVVFLSWLSMSVCVCVWVIPNLWKCTTSKCRAKCTPIKKTSLWSGIPSKSNNNNNNRANNTQIDILIAQR